MSFTETAGQLETLIARAEEELCVLRDRASALAAANVPNFREDDFRAFMREPYVLVPKGGHQWYCLVPRFLDFAVGWLERTTSSYNVFLINRYTLWLGAVPEDIRDQTGLTAPPGDLSVVDGRLLFGKGQKPVAEQYKDFISAFSGDAGRIKRGREFDLLAALVRDGYLPFVPQPVAESDKRIPTGNFSFEGKYSYQREAFEEFMRRGALGVFWMTSAGKSFLTMAVLDALKGRKLIVVPTRTLVDQWKEYLRRHVDRLYKEATYGYGYQGSQVEIVTYNAYEKVRKNQYVCVVFDECHRLPANSFSKLATINAKYRLGLSASPYREDGRSVAYDEPTLVSRGGRIQMVKIGEYIDSLLPQGVDVAKTLLLDVLSYENGRAAWKRVTQVSRHPTPEAGMYRLIAQSGRAVTLTDSHSIMVVNDAFEVVAKRCDEMSAGDVVLSPKRIPGMKGSGGHELARLLGWYVAEGSCVKQNGQGYCVSFSLHAKETAEAVQIASDLQHVAGLRSKVVPDKENSQKVIAAYKQAYEFFADLGFSGKTAHTKRVPEVVYNIPTTAVSTFLNAYQKGDAGVTVNPELASDVAYLYALSGAFATIHKSLNKGGAKFPDGHIIEQPVLRYVVQEAARRRSPFSMLPVRWIEKNFGPVLTKRRKEDGVRSVESFSFGTFQRTIGLEAFERLSVLRWIARHGKVTRKALPGSGAREPRSASAYLLALHKRGLIDRTRRGHRHTGPTVWRLTSEGQRIVAAYERMAKLMAGDFAFLSVKSVEPVEYNHPYVYDFHVPGTETFVAGSGGLLCHNTNFIIALTGWPTGMDWRSMMDVLGKDFHTVDVHVVPTPASKLVRVGELFRPGVKTAIFSDSIDVGASVARRLGIPHIHGGTSNRLKVAQEAKAFVASRVFDEGVSLPDLEHIIEVDFLGGSRRQEVQRTGRLMHSQVGESHHDIIMTREEFDRFKARLNGLTEKGFKVNVHA